MIWFIWILGYLFTIGFHRMDRVEQEAPGLIYIVLFSTWPIILGRDIRYTLS